MINYSYCNFILILKFNNIILQQNNKKQKIYSFHNNFDLFLYQYLEFKYYLIIIIQKNSMHGHNTAQRNELSPASKG